MNATDQTGAASTPQATQWGGWRLTESGSCLVLGDDCYGIPVGCLFVINLAVARRSSADLVDLVRQASERFEMTGQDLVSLSRALRSVCASA